MFSRLKIREDFQPLVKDGMASGFPANAPPLSLPVDLCDGDVIRSLAILWRSRPSNDRRYVSGKRPSFFAAIDDLLDALPLGPNALAKIGMWPEAMILSTIERAITCGDPVEAMRTITKLDGFSPVTASHILHLFSPHHVLVMNEPTLSVVDRRTVSSIKGARFWSTFCAFSASSCAGLAVDVVTLQHAIWEYAASRRSNFAKM